MRDPSFAAVSLGRGGRAPSSPCAGRTPRRPQGGATLSVRHDVTLALSTTACI